MMITHRTGILFFAVFVALAMILAGCGGGGDTRYGTRISSPGAYTIRGVQELWTADPPTGLAAMPSDQAALVFWEEIVDANSYKKADSYNIYWSINSEVDPTPAEYDGTDSVSADDDTVYFHTGLTNGDTVRFYLININL